MEQRIKERLEQGGIQVDSALHRFLGNEELLFRFLKKFPQEDTYLYLEKAIAQQDWEAAQNLSHTLKGVCGNLSMTGLFDLLTRQVAAFRAGDTALAVELMEQIAPAYRQAAQAIAGLDDHGKE